MIAMASGRYYLKYSIIALISNNRQTDGRTEKVELNKCKNPDKRHFKFMHGLSSNF